MTSEEQKAWGQAEQRLIDMFEHAGIGMYRTTPDGRILMANPAMVRMLGFSSFEELRRRSLEDGWYEPHYARSVFKQRIEEENQILGLESEWVRRDGARLVGVENARVVRDETGQILYYEGTVTDITQRKELEEKLREGEDLYRSVVDGSPALLCHFLPDGKITFVNTAYCKYFGKTREELLGKTFLSLIPEEDRQAVMDNILSLTVDSPSMTHEHKVIDSNGRVCWQRWANRAFFGEYGHVLHFQSFGEDITERRSAEEDARRGHELIRGILDNAGSIVVVRDMQGRYIMVNREVENALGIKGEEIIGKTPYDIHSSDKAGKILADDKRVIDSRRLLHIEDQLDVDGRTHDFMGTKFPLLDAAGEPYAVCTVATDITDRKKTEHELRQSEEKFRLAMETTNDALWDWNMVINEVYRNPRHATMLGYEPHELTPSQDEWEERIHPDDRQLVFETLNAHLAGRGDAWRLEYRLRHKSGDYVWVLGRGRVIARDKDGSPLRMIGTNIDITERKIAEEALRESEQRLRAVFDYMVDGVLLADVQSRKFYMGNKMICEMLGYDQEELRNLGPADIHPEQDLAYTMEQFEKAARRELKIVEGLAVKRKDGSIFYADVNTFPIVVGGREYLVGVFRDITDRKSSEASLRESEEKYRTLVESAGESIASVNRDGVFLFMNEIAAERLGGKPGDFFGRTMWDLFPKETAERQMDSVRKVIETGEGMNVVVPTTLQGQMRWHNTTIGPLRDQSGKVVAVMVVARDIHELKKAEEELSKYREQMAEAERLASLGTVSATLAHQVTQPLTVIRLCLENSLDELEGKSCSKAVIRRLEESVGQVSNITAIVNNFRSFARRSSDTWIGLVSVWAVAERITRLLNETARQAHVRFFLKNLDKLTPVMLRERELEQLFFALIENSIQAADGKKPRQIVIRGAMKDKHLELRFYDNCGGIAAENIDKIFEPFFTTKPPGHATGLGLCIARDVVTRAGGNIRVESEFGVGTTFIVTLPANEAGT